MKEGSSLVTVSLQQFPFVVGIFAVKLKNADKKEFKGTGMILDGYVMTANHVVDQVKPALLDEARTHALYARTYDGKYHELGEWIQLHTDAIAFKAPPGYKSGKIETLTRPQHAQVVAAREQSNSSMGIIMNKPDIAYGFVEYDGSTIAGFSGAPYTNGQKVLGMHLQGGTGGNFGYSASFLISRLRRVIKPESSEWEAFEKALAQAARDDVEWNRGLDETEVRVGGRYFLFDNEEFDEYVEESEFMDWFYESYEQDGETKEKKKRFRRSKHYEKQNAFLEEPEYEGGDDSFLNPQPPTSVTKEEQSFLVNSPPKDLNGGALQQAIDSLTVTMLGIQNTLTSLQKDLVGLREQQLNFEKVSTSTLESVQKLNEKQFNQLGKKLNTLELNLTELTTLNSENPQTSMTQSGICVSGQSSEPLNPRAVQDSENSPTTLQSDKRWVGMDSDFERFKMWRASVNVLDPEYVALRQTFLDKLGLDQNQSRVLINRMKNFLLKSKGRKWMREHTTTGSNSS